MLYNLLVVSARKSPSPSLDWLVYLIGGRRATRLGTVKAASMEAAITATSVEFGAPVNRILVQQVVHA